MIHTVESIIKCSNAASAWAFFSARNNVPTAARKVAVAPVFSAIAWNFTAKFCRIHLTIILCAHNDFHPVKSDVNFGITCISKKRLTSVPWQEQQRICLRHVWTMLKSVNKISSNFDVAVHMVTRIKYLSDKAAVHWGQHSSQRVSLVFRIFCHVIQLNFHLLNHSSILYMCYRLAWILYGLYLAKLAMFIIVAIIHAKLWVCFYFIS